jgi:hypothetical protein
MPFVTDDLKRAREAFVQFQRNAASPHHARYSFPFFAGTYFGYRKVDVLRVVAIARAAEAAAITPTIAGGNNNDVKGKSNNPSYLDVGCGYGDFLKRIREYLPNAEGLEKDSGIFYNLSIEKQDYIKIADAHWIDKRYDVIFVGWMEPGQDFRDPVAKNTDVIVTTLDQGISLAAEFDGHGFDLVASWQTPTWEDVNIEIMNRYYTKIDEEKRIQLARMRGAHNLWYVYARHGSAADVKKALQTHVATEGREAFISSSRSMAAAATPKTQPRTEERYDFEDVLDECGFGYLEKLENPAVQYPLWHVCFY